MYVSSVRKLLWQRKTIGLAADFTECLEDVRISVFGVGCLAQRNGLGSRDGCFCCCSRGILLDW